MAKTPKPKIPKAPRHLALTTRRWWVHVTADWSLEQHHIRLLTLAGEAWDRGVMARKALETNGLTFNDRWGQPHARPEVAIERDSRIAFSRLLRELSLDIEEPGDELRAPRITGNAALKVSGR